MSGTPCVRVVDAGAVRTIVLARPEARNAVNPEMADALLSAFQDFEAEPALRVVVLWGEGGHFCAGADLKAVAAGETFHTAPDGPGPLGPTRLRLTKPSIAAVAGHAVAGGLELALLCDLRVVEASATFGVYCRRFGVPLVDGGTVRLPRLIGLSRALDLVLTGRAVPATEAFAMGLANRVVPDGTSLAAATALALELAAHPWDCLMADRHSTVEGQGLPLEAALRFEIENAQVVLKQSVRDGAARYARGAGRHGGAV